MEDLIPLFIDDKNSLTEKAKMTKEQQKWVPGKTLNKRKSQYWGMYD